MSIDSNIPTRPSSNSYYMATESGGGMVRKEALQQQQQQRQVMSQAEFEVEVKDWWIHGGRLGIPKEFRNLFPNPGESVTLIDNEGRAYRSKMHNLWQGVDIGRIDGLKPFYRNHPTVVAGSRLRLNVRSRGTALVLLGDNSLPFVVSP